LQSGDQQAILWFVRLFGQLLAYRDFEVKSPEANAWLDEPAYRSMFQPLNKHKCMGEKCEGSSSFGTLLFIHQAC